MQNIKGFRPGIDEISREIEAPRFFTAKILQRLVRMGFVMSLKGKGGGFFFDKEKPEITIKELIAATEGDKIITGCGFGLKNCTPDNPCPMHERYAPIRDAIEDLVTSETIKSLALNYSKSTNSV